MSFRKNVRFVCGVKIDGAYCQDGYIVEQTSVTVVECDTHNSRTTWDTEEKVEREQKIIRVQDQWRQHGVTRTPKK